MASEAFNWHVLALELLGLPSSERQVAHLLPLRGYDAIPLCHFQSSFGVFALCSDILSPSWIWSRTSRQVGQRYNLRFTCSHHVQIFASDQPRHTFFFLPPPSFHNQLPHHIAVLVGPRFFALPSPAELLPSTLHTRVWLPSFFL